MMRNRRKPKPYVNLTRKQFFFKCGAVESIYCMFAWLLLLAAAAQNMNFFGEQGTTGDKMLFAAAFFGGIGGLIALNIYIGLRGRQRYPDWERRDIGMLLLIAPLSVAVGFALMYLAAMLFRL